jgi:hypothetical protein
MQVLHGAHQSVAASAFSANRRVSLACTAVEHTLQQKHFFFSLVISETAEPCRLDSLSNQQQGNVGKCQQRRSRCMA